MKTNFIIFSILACLFILYSNNNANEIKNINDLNLKLSGTIQLQQLSNFNISPGASITNNGFRIRRGRLKVSSQLNNSTSATIQIEVRDNDPQLKDAVGKIVFFEIFFIRFGQFQVPVWREELRSSGKLLLIERSAVADFLEKNYLSSRHLGFEFGGNLKNGASFTFNYSNGAGEGGREDADQLKNKVVNNGKLSTMRVNMPVGQFMQIGLSGAIKKLGESRIRLNNIGNTYAIVPDFGVYLANWLDIEGGFALGKINKTIEGMDTDQHFSMAETTVRWKHFLKNPDFNLGGLNGWELAAGVAFVEPNGSINKDEFMTYRFGPAVHFGDNTRIQLNGEFLDYTGESDTTFKVRTQITVNF